MRPVPCVLAAAFLLALSGCGSGWNARKNEDAQRARRQAEDARRKRSSLRTPGDEPPMRAAKLELGLSAGQVKSMLGEPRRSRRMTSLEGVFDLFEYDGKNLRFKNDRLIEIRDMP